ncbi:acyl carrier protein [Umezawaea sp.]|uniref:acyl carrier protein n=1 Tax=Umezawaea sp. TaxID=1955258 RepID=UPI002ED64A85
MDTTLSPTDLAALINRCTGVAVTGDQVCFSQQSFDELGVDSLGLMGVVAELQRNHGMSREVDVAPDQSPRELLSLLTGRA